MIPSNPNTIDIHYSSMKRENDENLEENQLKRENPFINQVNTHEIFETNNSNINNVNNNNTNLMKIEGQLIPQHQQPISFLGKSILIVDDSIVIQKTTTELLIREGFEVAVAKHGKECIKLLQQRKYDYILMDIQMPIMNGIETTLYIRQYEMEWLTPSLREKPDEEWGEMPDTITYNRHIIIGYLTTLNNNETIENLLSIGMDDVVYKPLDIEMFLCCLTKLSTTLDPLRVL